MDWLRSEDLKEEKVVTTPVPLYHARKYFACSKWTCESAKGILAKAIKEMAKPRVASSARERCHVEEGSSSHGAQC